MKSLRIQLFSHIQGWGPWKAVISHNSILNIDLIKGAEYNYMSNDQNPLEKLYTDEIPYDQDRLAQVLLQYIKIDSTDSSVLFKPAFDRLDDKQKVICRLLSLRALHDLGEISESEIGVEAIEIDRSTGVHEADVLDTCVDLSIVEIEHGDYGRCKIPAVHVDTAISYLEGTVGIEDES